MHVYRVAENIPGASAGPKMMAYALFTPVRAADKTGRGQRDKMNNCLVPELFAA